MVLVMDRAAGWILLQASLLFTGCIGTQSGTESERPGLTCKVVRETSLASSSVTDFGTPEELAAHAGQAKNEFLRWYSHDTEGGHTDTVLDAQLTATLETAKSLEREGECGNALALQATLTFSTRDGTFAEQVPGTLLRDHFGDHFEGEMPLETLAGSYDFAWAEGEYHEPVLVFRTELSPLEGSLVIHEGDDARDGFIASGAVAEWGFTSE